MYIPPHADTHQNLDEQYGASDRTETSGTMAESGIKGSSPVSVKIITVPFLVSRGIIMRKCSDMQKLFSIILYYNTCLGSEHVAEKVQIKSQIKEKRRQQKRQS